MRYEILYYGGIIGAVITGVCSMVLFWIFKIYRILGNVTGLTAKRSIKKLKEQGLDEEHSKSSAIHNNTSKMMVKHGKTTTKLRHTTGRLSDRKQSEEATTLLSDSNATTLLTPDSPETTVLMTDNPKISEPMKFSQFIEITLIQNDVIIHTNEYIS
ncbi:MAG: hypothetical protein ACI4DO_08400 [Roseburia sp.]